MLPSKQELVTLLGTLYDAAADPGLWSAFIEELGAYSGATSAVLVMHDLERASCSVSSCWRADPEKARLYEEHYHNLDVWVERSSGRPAGRVYESQSVCTLSELRTTEIYNDFYVKCDMEHAAFGLLENSRVCLGAVSLFRDRSCSEFAEGDLHTLQFVIPHLQRAFRLHRQFAEMRSRAAGLEAALDMVATPVILFGLGGRIAGMNRSAAALVGERDGLVASGDGLRAERPAESGLLAKAIERASCVSRSNEDRVGETVWVSRRKGGPLQVLVSPIGKAAYSGNGAITAIAFVNDPARRQRPAQDILRVRFGLTPAESRVAMLLCDGRAPKGIAETIGVSVETVRSQMKSIFSKADVRRQSELVRLLLCSSGQMAPEQAKR